ncbi:hypothetical protein BH09GEM1_BH09GEM1_09750 [soil metagenome]
MRLDTGQSETVGNVAYLGSLFFPGYPGPAERFNAIH